jgi:hypothetical protein
MTEKQKPQADIVKIAARVLKDPNTATQHDAQRMAARILDDEKNDPQPNKTKPRPKSSIQSAGLQRSLGAVSGTKTSGAKKKR